MNNSCIVIPTVKVGNQNKESKLFKGLLSQTRSRETTKYIYEFTKVPEIQEYFDNAQRDENNEITLTALNKLINIDKITKSNGLFSQKLNIGAINEKGDVIYYKTFSEIFNRVTEFNSQNPQLVAGIHRTPKGYTISLERKNIDNSDEPNKLLFNNALNNQLLSILRRLGFDVKVDGSLLYDGIFDPEHAEINKDNLITAIRISEGQRGQDAFPEEFCHLVIAGLNNHSLVRRLLDILSNEEIQKQYLGKDYEHYYNKYKGNKELMAQEAAAKALVTYIQNPSKDIPLLERLWNFIKTLFRRVSETEVEKAITVANKGFAKLSTQIMNESILDELDKKEILDSKPLYKLNKDIDKMQNLAEEALEVASKRLAIIQRRTKGSAYSKDDIISIKNLKSLIERKKYAKSYLAFLNDSLIQIEELQNELNKLYKKDIRKDNDLTKIRRIAFILRNIKEFIDGYEPIIKQMMQLKQLQEQGEIDIDEEDAVAISEKALNIFSNINNINLNYKELRYNLVFNFLKIYWGEDKIVEIGKNKGDIITLDMIMSMANKDIGGVDRWLSSLGDASDPLLSLIDKIVKNTKSKRDALLEDITADIRRIHQDYVESTGSNDTSFMFERDSEGNLTGRLISDYDFERFNKEREAEYNRLRELNLKPYQIKARIEAWERRHTQEIVIDAESGRTELVPIYTKDNLSKLTKEQRDYYDSMMEAKAAMESLLPKGYARLYNAIYVRSGLIPSLTESNNTKEAVKQIIGNIKDSFIRRSDDTEFGEEAGVLLNFSGKPVDRVPIYYTTPLENMNRLSQDFTSSIMSYAGMSINYSEMNKVVDVLELTRDLTKDRKVEQMSGDKKLMETFKIMGNKFKKTYVKTGAESNIGSRIDDYYDTVIYNKLKRDEGSIASTGIDKAKTLDKIKEYSGVIGLGLNIFSAINNITQGKLQMFIEAVGGEYFNYKNLAVGTKNYWKYLPEYMGEIASNKKTNIMALLIDKFDALEEFYNSIGRDTYKGPLKKIFGETSLFLLNNMGEHYLHTRTLFTMLDTYKVMYKGKEISLFDAFEVEKFTNEQGKVLTAKLKLKDGVKNKDGSDVTEQDLIDLKLKIGKINQSMNGAFNDADKGSIHRYALGRLAMQFRQWMPAHYNRRFAGTYYDAIMDQQREGFYRTLYNFTLNLMKDLVNAKFQIATRFNELNSHQKANIKRALTEISLFYCLALFISFMGTEKDRKGVWEERMLSYNLKRMKLETGASMPLSPDFFDNLFTIMQSPAAAIKPINNLLDLLQFQNMFVEIQSGRYKGYSRYEKDLIEVVPVYGKIRNVLDIADEDYMFTIYNK